MIVYLHGFNSSPQSRKAQVLGAHLGSLGLGKQFRCPALPHRPVEAVPVIRSACADVDPRRLTLVGSSLGGFYATWCAETLGARAVLINPAVAPHETLEVMLGPQKNLYTGEAYELTREDLDVLRALRTEHINPERYLLLLETGDEVLDWREAARKYEGARMCVRDGGDHTLQSFGEHLPRILAFCGLTPAR